MLGSHLSIAGGLTNALDEAKRLKMDCVQIFTRNQRQWAVKPLSDDDSAGWLNRLDELGWDTCQDVIPRRGAARVVSHNSYLINMASPDREMREKSIRLQREEIERCEVLRIPYLVAHPGAHLGESRPAGEPHDLEAAPTKDEQAGLRRIARALDRLHRETRGYRTITCLETTVGSGSNLGYAFHHLEFIRSAVKFPERVSFCLDTCHVTAAGYDMRTDERAAAVLEQFDEVCGLEALSVVHVNDSVGAVGSRRDRHAHINEGACGRACFRAILNHEALSRVPRILETPKGTTEKGTPLDVINMRRLKRLMSAPSVADKTAVR